MKQQLGLLVLSLTLAACDGPAEQAGAAKDKAEAEAIEKEQNSIRSAADIEAERLEQQADALRKAADAKAEAIKGDAAK